MMISFVLITFFFWSMHLLQKQISMSLLKKSNFVRAISPQTTIIAFDIHGVLFEPDKNKIKKIIKSNPSIFIILIYILQPRFLFDLFKLIRKKAVPEEIISYLSSRYRLIAKHKQLAIQLANAQQHVAHMESMIQSLKDSGYVLHIFSNIGSDIFKELSAQHYNLFKQFDTVYIPHSENNFIGKPHSQAFLDYSKRCNDEHRQIIFIDNRWINIKKAHQCNIFGIHFKSSEQLTAELEKLGVIDKTIAIRA